jgi:iron complex transport system permease protein
VIVLLVAALLVSVTLAVMIGPVAIPARVVWGVAAHHIWPAVFAPAGEPFQADIVWQIRFPRTLLAALVGGGLALVGTAMQALVRNPLADPYLLGVSSGASAAAVAVILLGFTMLGRYTLPLGAFSGALVAFVAVYLLANQNGYLASDRLILSGVAVSYVFSGLTSFLVFSAHDPNEVRSVLFWLMGGLGGARWEVLLTPLVAILCAGALLLYRARELNALLIGEETAVSLGIEPHRIRRQLFAVTALVTGVLVAVSGGIGFIGLMVPHIVRRVVGTDHRRVFPAAALGGAAFLVWADVVARTVFEPREMPIGIITALTGAPFFLWLMRHTDSRRTRP